MEAAQAEELLPRPLKELKLSGNKADGVGVGVAVRGHYTPVVPGGRRRAGEASGCHMRPRHSPGEWRSVTVL